MRGNHNALSHRASGAFGEELACRFLESKGYKIAARNYTVRGGEIDIAAVSPCGKYIVFAEVKTRFCENFGKAAEAVDKRKISRLCLAAERFLYEKSILLQKQEKCEFDFLNLSPRFDVIEVYAQPYSEKTALQSQKHRINHIKNIDIN